MERSSWCTHVSRREGILEEVVGERVHCIGKLQITGSSSAQSASMPGVIGRACIGTEMVEVELRDAEVAWAFAVPGYSGEIFVCLIEVAKA